MSEQENICGICGGMKALYRDISSLTGQFTFKPTSEVKIGPISLSGTRVFTLCSGHPEPAEKHDGKLDEQDKAEVWFTKGLSITPYVHISDQDEVVVLEARQALSLLA